MKLNRKLVLVLALVLSVAMATTGTLAYLTDRDSAANVFTMGNVSIKLNEKFEQNSELLPGMEVAKEPTIKNTGSVDAYVWMQVAIPTGMMDALTITGLDDDTLNSTGWNKLAGNPSSATINDKSCEVYTYLYNNKLEANAETNSLFTKVKMSEKVDATPNGDVYLVVNGSTTKLGYNINDGELPIYVSAYAIQAEQFENVQAAYSAYNNQWGNNGTEWGNADTPITEITVNSQSALDDALEAGKTGIELGAGTYTLSAQTNKTMLIAGTTDTVIDMTKSGIISSQNANLNITFDGVTVKFANEDNYKGITHSSKVVYKNCVLEGKQFLYADNVEFINCTLKNDSDYSVWTYGANNVKFENCTFMSGGKAILIYSEDLTHTNNVTVNNCTFYDNGKTLDNGNPVEKAAIEIGDSQPTAGLHVNLTATNNTVYGFSTGKNTNTKLYGNKNSIPAERLKVTANNNTEKEGADLYISNAKELFAFAEDVNVKKNNYSGKTVMLIDDIDLNNAVWTPIGQTNAPNFYGTFDGNGYTIKNLKINDAATAEHHQYGTGLFGWLTSQSDPACIKNLTVDNATVEASHYAGVIVGYVEYGSVVNCHVTNSKVTDTHKDDERCGDKAGGAVGFVNNGNSSAMVKECSVSNTTVAAARDAGQVVGAAKSSQVTDCSATSVNVSKDTTAVCNDSGSGQNITNGIIGRELPS